MVNVKRSDMRHMRHMRHNFITIQLWFLPQVFSDEIHGIPWSCSTGSASALWGSQDRSHQHGGYGDFHISQDEMGISWEFQCKI